MKNSCKTLGIKNTHLPLRERVRLALIENRKEVLFANASPDQLEELSQRIGHALHLTQNAVRYQNHLESANLTDSPSHLNGLASIKRQANEAGREASLEAICGPVNEPAESEIEAALKAYLESQGKEYDPTR